MKTSENIIEISKAMNLAQREMRPAIKDSTNPHYKSRYSDLASVMDAIREPIGNNGLSIWQDATLEDLGVSVTTRIVHISGQWVEFGPLTIPIGKKDAHAVGSACSYGKRYALCAALGVVSDDDDDGNKAVSSYEKKHVVSPSKMVVSQTKNNDKMAEMQGKYNQELDEIQGKNISNNNIDHIADFNKMIDNTPKTINKEQVRIYNDLYDKCSEDFRNKADEYLGMLKRKVDELDEYHWSKCIKSFENHLKGISK